MFDDISQLLNLYRLVVKDGFPFAEQGELLQLGVGVGNVPADGLSDADELGIICMCEAPGHPAHCAIHRASPEALHCVPELQSAIPAAAHPDVISL